MIKTARKWSLDALNFFSKTGVFLDEYFEKHRDELSEKDRGFAKELTYGTMRYQRLLDHYGDKLSEKGKLRLKGREKWLFRLAVYERFFLNKPDFATVHSWVTLAKKESSRTFASFLNALLRKEMPSLPEDLGLRFSYPDYFVEKLKIERGDEAPEILDAMNAPPRFMARTFSKSLTSPNWISEKYSVLFLDAFSDEIASNPDLYIQNITPVSLLSDMLEKLPSLPKTILDLAAAPGGKLLHAARAYPEAALFANEPSLRRQEVLKDNIEKYSLKAEISSHDGREYPKDALFDLVILDAPCSNTGVLNKRPEARWRLSAESEKEQADLQKELLSRALELVAPGGFVIYLTCSILREENEEVIEDALKAGTTSVVAMQTILPNKDGYDGGFAALLTKL